ncbi:hypothetical protein [Ferruginibacter sp.]
MKNKLLLLSILCCIVIQLNAQLNTIPAKPTIAVPTAPVRLPGVSSIVLVQDSVTASHKLDGTPMHIHHLKATISSYGLTTINYRWATMNLNLPNQQPGNKPGSITTNGTGSDIVRIDVPDNGLTSLKIVLVVDAPTTVVSNSINL